MKFFAVSTFLAFLLSLPAANARLTAVVSGSDVDYNAVSDVFVVGYAGKLKGAFLETAETYIRKTQEQYPERQIVMFLENLEEEGTSAQHVISAGLNIVSANDKPMTATYVGQQLAKFSQIQTLHIVSHNALNLGPGMTDRNGDKRLTVRSAGMNKLNFTATGYMVLHGCNSGFVMAPEFSLQYGVPVFGSHTGTSFHHLTSSGQWYPHANELIPSGMSFTNVNNQSFTKPVACGQGGCLKLKPDFSPYSGYWGDYNPAGGLPFYKAYCNFGNSLNMRKARCYSAMVQWAQVFPSITRLHANSPIEQYKMVVADLLCPINSVRNVRERCIAAMRAFDSNPNTPDPHVFLGNALKCENFGSCEFGYSCPIDANNHKCYVQATQTDRSTSTLLNEYKAYVDAYYFDKGYDTLGENKLVQSAYVVQPDIAIAEMQKGLMPTTDLTYVSTASADEGPSNIIGELFGFATGRAAAPQQPVEQRRQEEVRGFFDSFLGGGQNDQPTRKVQPAQPAKVTNFNKSAAQKAEEARRARAKERQRQLLQTR